MMKRALYAAFAALGICISATSAASQDTSRVPGPTLLRRLAEAVDGNRTGQAVWVVARWDSLNRVMGTFTTEREARALAGRQGTMVGVFGPYTAPREVAFPVMPDINPNPDCWHNETTSDWRICPEAIFPPGVIREMTLVINMRDGSTRTWRIPGSADALFLSLAAVDKFALPYYAGVVGIEAAAAMRRDLVNRLSRQR